MNLREGRCRDSLTGMAQDQEKERVDAGDGRHVSCCDWLLRRRDELQRELALYRRLEARWSWVRLLAFVAGGVAVILLWQHGLLAALAGAGGLGVFAGAVLRHTTWEGRREASERGVVVVEESIHAGTKRDRPARAWQRPENPADADVSLPVVIESGTAWPLTDQERDDLDLYGPPVGIFGLLNRTSTGLGARRLRDMLDAPCLSPECIRQRQQAVRWLEEHNEQRLGMMASVVPLRGRSGRLDRLVHLLHRVEYRPRPIASAGIRLWSVPSGLLALYAIAGIANGNYSSVRILVALLVLNSLILLIWRRMFEEFRAVVAPWTDLGPTLKCFLAVAEHGARDLPEETPLGVLKGHFHKVVTDTRIPSMCAWLEWAALHRTARSLFNVTVFLDLHIGEAVLTRTVPQRDVFLHGLSCLAELEALCSLASFSAEQPVACYPQLAAATCLTIEEGRHPLLLEPDVVANSLHLTSDKRTWVITGPNAAGKSTFLRMAGVNMVLAQVGAAVPATAMTWSPVRLITDVRIRDDLARNESYFLSEVRRLRRLVLDSESGTPVLGLIDEPFRGTNSQERTAAGVALLEHLAASHNLFLIATHEETLAQTALRAASADNYHFQEHLHDGGITFDYRLRPGPASTKTALRILEREGYPPALLERARGLMPPER
jgi:ABC-type lipoprotein export system ATPase subunit